MAKLLIIMGGREGNKPLEIYLHTYFTPGIMGAAWGFLDPNIWGALGGLSKGGARKLARG